MQEENNSPPLQGLHVLELGTGVAAPYAGFLLSLLGATVVKAEPAEGDPAREYPVDDAPLPGVSPLFLYLNAGKSSIDATPERIRRGLRWADVVVDSRVQRELDPDTAAAVARGNPRYASVTAWGFNAEHAGRIDDELIVQARSGVMTLTGDPDREPLRFPGLQSQYLAGAFTAAAIVAAQQAEDAGRFIEVAWVAAMTAGTEGSYQRYLYTGIVPPPAGANPTAAFPAGAFRCADGYVVPGTVRQHDWEMQCLLYEMPELISDERFSTPGARTANYRELWDLIQPWYDAHTREHIFRRALEVGWACGMVLDGKDALSDEHLCEREFLGDATDGTARWLAPSRLALGLERAAYPVVRQRGADNEWFDRTVGAD